MSKVICAENCEKTFVKTSAKGWSWKAAEWKPYYFGIEKQFSNHNPWLVFLNLNAIDISWKY